MSDLLIHPAFQSAVLPFAVALCAAAVLGFSSPVTARYAGLAVVAGFLAAYVSTFGLPPLLPKTSGQKIFAIAVLATIGSLLFDGHRTMAVGLHLALISILWIGWRKIMAAPSLDHLSALLIVAGAAVALLGTERDGNDDDVDKAVPFLIVSLGVAGIAFIGASTSIAQNAGALSAALGGLLILNWPKRRFGFGLLARWVPLIVLSALSAQIVFFTSAPAWTLVLLLPAFYVERRVTSTSALKRPVLIALCAAVPTGTAFAAAWFAASSNLSGGY